LICGYCFSEWIYIYKRFMGDTIIHNLHHKSSFRDVITCVCTISLNRLKDKNKLKTLEVTNKQLSVSKYFIWKGTWYVIADFFYERYLCQQTFLQVWTWNQEVLINNCVLLFINLLTLELSAHPLTFWSSQNIHPHL